MTSFRFSRLWGALIAWVVAGCSMSSIQAVPSLTPYIIEVTATPPGVPTDPLLTTTLTPSLPPGSPATLAATDPALTASITPTPWLLVSSTPTPVTTARPENRFANPGFEFGGRERDSSHRIVAEGWEPFFCAPPYTGTCYASRAGQDEGNPDGLEMSAPWYAITGEAGRVRSGLAAQHWFCDSAICRGGIYQTIAATPGEVCEVGAFVQSWSTNNAAGFSTLRTDDDRANVTWYIRVDPSGGTAAWAGHVRASQPFGYAQGVYDRYARISTTFTAASSSTTIFFENTRLWPFQHNDSYLDDAYARCGPPTVTPPPPALPSVQVGSFTVLRNNIAWPGSDIADMVRVGEEWWAYYSDTANGRLVINRATSRDGVTWIEAASPALDASQAGLWDSAALYGPTVLIDPATERFEMWYIGRDNLEQSYNYAFGYATSPDGLTFTRAQSTPVLTHGAPGAWDEERIDSVEVVWDGETYRMFYSGTVRQPNLIRQIGCATSANGSDWQPCPSNPVLWPEAGSAPWEGLELEQPSVALHEGDWLMAYTGFLGPQGNHWRIGLAVSADGEHWTRLALDPLIALPAEAQHSTTDPALIYNAERGELWLYYGDTRYGPGISLATAPVTFGP